MMENFYTSCYTIMHGLLQSRPFIDILRIILIGPQIFCRVCCFAVLKIHVSLLKFGANAHIKRNYLKNCVIVGGSLYRHLKRYPDNGLQQQKRFKVTFPSAWKSVLSK